MREPERRPRNLLEMVPRRAHAWIEAEDGRVRVQVPRYGTSRLGRWAAGKIGRPHILVNLDEVGSAIWRACDGEATVGQIADRVERQLGEERGALRERLGKFLRELERTALISWAD